MRREAAGLKRGRRSARLFPSPPPLLINASNKKRSSISPECPLKCKHRERILSRLQKCFIQETAKGTRNLKLMFKPGAQDVKKLGSRLPPGRRWRCYYLLGNLQHSVGKKPCKETGSAFPFAAACLSQTKIPPPPPRLHAAGATLQSSLTNSGASSQKSPHGKGASEQNDPLRILSAV